VRAVCCSGGGIRAAAYVLGGLQRLGRPENGQPSWYAEADFVTAVSGGSYMASSFAMLNHDLTGDLPPYAPGSPEEHRLRAHTRYLVEDPRVAAIGIVSILYGLLLNLVPLLAMLYVVAKLLGWGLHAWHVLEPTQSNEAWKLGHVGSMIVVVLALVVVGVVLFSIERLHDVYHSPRDGLTRFLDAWTLRVLGLAAWAAALLLGVPLLLRAASTTSIHPGGLPFGDQATGFAATSLAIVGLVKGRRPPSRPSAASRVSPQKDCAPWPPGPARRWASDCSSSPCSRGRRVLPTTASAGRRACTPSSRW
jgi:hypothetical protein